MSTVEGGGNIVTDGLVLYLDAANPKSYVSGSTTWTDISKGGNNGTLLNGFLYSNTNKGEITFDGVNQWVTFQNNPNLYFLGLQPYTLSIWVNIVSATSGIFHGLINREFGAPRNGYNLWFFRDPTVIAIASERFGGTGQKVTFVLLPFDQSIGVWNQFTVTFDGLTLRFYLNGLLAHSAAANGNITNTSGTLQIARRQTDFANCKIANVLIYGKSLSDLEVLQNFNATRSRFGI
jgi:hypothetical protein